MTSHSDSDGVVVPFRFAAEPHEPWDDQATSPTSGNGDDDSDSGDDGAPPVVPPAPDIELRRVAPVPTDDAPPRPGSLHPGVTVERDWPARTALVVGTAPHPVALAALRRLGIDACIAPVHRVEAMLPAVGPYTFLLVGADVLADPAGVENVQAWRKWSPSAHVKLVTRPTDTDPAVWLAAIRAGVDDVLDPLEPEKMSSQLAAGLRTAGQQRERVLAIGAHLDDVETGCGGALLDHRRRGDRITILTLTRGGTDDDQLRRLQSARRTASAIGAQLMFADLPDGHLDEGGVTAGIIANVVGNVDPTVVYVHSEHDSHQDHRAVHTAARGATSGVMRVFAYQSPSATNDFHPTRFVPIDSVVTHKVDVLGLFDGSADRPHLEPELVTAGARYWARHLGANARYAEPFEVVHSVGDLRHAVAAPTADPAVAPMTRTAVAR